MPRLDGVGSRHQTSREASGCGSPGASLAYTRDVRTVLFVASLVAVATAFREVKIDISPQDIERALTVARSRDSDRARFHAPYIQALTTPFVDRVEVVTELRRVVLLAEERAARGDRFFGYSVTAATEALSVWRRRISVLARVRFHPQNVYVVLPPLSITVEGNERALIGVRAEPLVALPGKTGESVPILGALVEGVFEAEALGQATREFVIWLEKRELARATFDLASLE
jgi:hypothetical protein